MSQLFARKAIEDLQPADGEQSLKRVLGAGDLVMLAIGAVIGAGIFGSIGSAAAGQIGPNGDVIRLGAGPALVVSFVLLGACCALAGLCYAELASMIPQAGSAYAYTYATLGELIAWIIGWDLILEYAVGNVAVAISWGDYFKSLLSGWVDLPAWLTTGYRTALLSADPAVHGLLDSAPNIACRVGSRPGISSSLKRATSSTTSISLVTSRARQVGTVTCSPSTPDWSKVDGTRVNDPDSVVIAALPTEYTTPS